MEAKSTVARRQLINDLVHELTSSHPRLEIVKQFMRKIGIKPGVDLLDCLTRTWRVLEISGEKNHEL